MDAVEGINFFAGVAELISGAIMLYQGWKLKKAKVFYQNKIRQMALEPDDISVIVNLSGHPIALSEDNWHQGKKIVTIHVGHVRPTHLNEEADLIVDILKPQIAYELERRMPIAFVLPGMAMLNHYLMPKIYGLLGVFPLVAVAFQTERGYSLRKPVNLNTVYEAGEGRQAQLGI
ncbi:CRISPR-associated protein Csx15 [Heliophilum fasciatum]|uniref:Uncharacterized protein n=1 Tax=Heliophilum fasciatum TaxID=35700 RepID=A0A4R2RCY2_9FIRM|nr:CRISPR-associated protein Csx15 [Heliophilum fasciatum]MCW2279333.1 hypothetical protein [Heliophilum fasciatum]TCP60314.1 hypothetical protein EDD73_13913 [Heliophilum fasciatum]